MSRPIPLDIEAPLASLLDAAGVIPAELARRRKVTAQSVNSSLRAPGIGLATLRAAAEACGGTIEIRFVPG